MTKAIQEIDYELRPGGTIKFIGELHGSGASFFHVRNSPGGGASLHRHPYAETWIVLKGEVRFEVDGNSIETTAGHVVVGPANIPHKFTNIGTGILEMICIHPAPVISQEDLME
jgi:quercetin dioxygenase-like cupin family protein